MIGGLLVDEFAPPLAGLCIAELELDSEEELRGFVPPPFVVAEVTHDERFTGGRYAGMTAAELAVLLAEKSIRRVGNP